MDNIDIFNNSAIIMNRKTPPKIISWITVIIVLLLLGILLSFYKFDRYYVYQGYFDSNNNLCLIVDYKYFDTIKNKYVYYDNKKYDYEIISMKPVINEKENYWVVLVKLDFKKIDSDEIMNFKVKSDEITVLDYIKGSD